MALPRYTIECPQGVYEKQIVITADMTDASGLMRPGDLAREMEKITASHLETCGIGWEEQQRMGKSWVIAWTSIEITRLPSEQMRVILRVWPGKNKTMMYTRRYAFYTADGALLACAASLFVLMDQETRKAAAPAEPLCAVPVVVLEGEPKLPKLQIDFPERLEGCCERIVAKEEIDQNGHLNNARYLDWAEDLLRESGLRMQAPERIWVRYNRELTEGQRVTLEYEAKDGAFYLQGSAEGMVSFQIKIDCQEEISG